MMNDCDIRIEVDQEKEVYHPGDTGTGTVHVEVNDDCQCDSLLIILEWYTHGRGNPTSQSVARRVLFEGEWTAGEHHTYDFELTFPPGPYTYHGNYLNVDWRVKAHANIPWATDPTWTYKLRLEPNGTEERFRPGDVDRAEPALAPRDDDQTISWGQVGCGGALVGFGLLIGIIFIPVVPGPDKIWPGFLALTILAVGGFVIFRAAQNYLVERQLGDVDVHLDSTEVRPGQTIQCQTMLDPPGTVKLNGITVRLHGQEEVVSGHGTNETTYTHTVHEEDILLEGSKQTTIRSRQRTFQTDLSIPDSAPFSFYAKDNQLKWNVEVSIDVPNFEWSHTEPLAVRPMIKS